MVPVSALARLAPLLLQPLPLPVQESPLDFDSGGTAAAAALSKFWALVSEAAAAAAASSGPNSRSPTAAKSFIRWLSCGPNPNMFPPCSAG